MKEAVKTWANGDCVSDTTVGEEWMRISIRVPLAVDGVSTNGTNATIATNSTMSHHFGARSRLTARADCKTSTIQSGDGCWAVANRCGISQSDLEKYNRDDLCNTLVKDEKVCCSSGTLPSTLPNGNADGTCTTRQVVSGDSCGSLASKCGISAADFMKVNTKTNLCSNLAEGQVVCCSNSKMPDLKPKPDSNGNCATYTTKKDDSCSKIASSRDLSVSDLEGYNKKTWGWNGCKRLFPDFKMCVSTGSPPMPANVPVSYPFYSAVPRLE
jgi:LysM repeat protein